MSGVKGKLVKAILAPAKFVFHNVSRLPDWALKAVFIGLAASGIDRFWLSKQPWYADMPMTGYSFQQKLLQERFEDSKTRSDVVLFDISQAFPSADRVTIGSDLETDTTQERRENLVQLGTLIKDIARYRPKAIAIDWQIAPADAEVVNAKSAHPTFAPEHVSLFKSINSVVTSGIPVVFGADWARGRSKGKSRLPIAALEPYAATLAIPDPSVGPYHAGGRSELRDGLTPLAVRVATLAKGGRLHGEPLWTRESRPGFSTLVPNQNSSSQDPADEDKDIYWLNYEAVPVLIKECFELSALNGNNEAPLITSDVVGERIRGRIVLLGDVRDRNPADAATLPVTSRCTADPSRDLGDAFAQQFADPADKRRALRNQMAVSSTAGVLLQASAIHTLLGRPIRSFSSSWSELAFALTWGLTWGFIGELASMIAFKFLKLQRHTAYAEMHLLAMDFLLATAVASSVLLWLSSLTHLHTVIVPLVPAMVMATIAEAVLNVCYAVYQLRRRAAKAAAQEAVE